MKQFGNCPMSVETAIFHLQNDSGFEDYDKGDYTGSVESVLLEWFQFSTKKDDKVSQVVNFLVNEKFPDEESDSEETFESDEEKVSEAPFNKKTCKTCKPSVTNKANDDEKTNIDKWTVIETRAANGVCVGCGKKLPTSFITVEALKKSDGTSITLKFCPPCIGN